MATSKSSDSDKTTTTADTSSSKSSGDDTTGTETVIDVTPASEQDYSDSKMVKDGEWNPATQGMPPDLRPKSNF